MVCGGMRWYRLAWGGTGWHRVVQGNTNGKGWYGVVQGSTEQHRAACSGMRWVQVVLWVTTPSATPVLSDVTIT